MPLVDLHVHTSASDGRYAPAELVSRAVKAGLTVLAITDHDTVGGITPALEAAQNFPKLTIIPGVEINTDVAGGEAHILGYFIDYNDAALLGKLQEMRNSRQERAQKMVAKLATLGMPLSWDRVTQIAATDSIGRPHIAQALLEKGYISSLKEAFEKYIGKKDHPAFVERSKLTPAEASRLIVKAGGLPVLAHPLTMAEPEAMIKHLKTAGLVGIEVYYGTYQAPDISRLLALTSKYHLIATGGSDYHGLDEATETGLGQSGVPMKAATELIALSKKR
jgi:3',5'-nucleoside bisphosphate phosphatase